MFYDAYTNELQNDIILSASEKELAKDLFDNAASAQVERSRYPIDSDGRHSATAKIGKWLVTGTLTKDGKFTTPVGSWRYLVLDLSGATQADGLRSRIEELEEQESQVAEWLDQD